MEVIQELLRSPLHLRQLRSLSSTSSTMLSPEKIKVMVTLVHCFANLRFLSPAPD